MSFISFQKLNISDLDLFIYLFIYLFIKSKYFRFIFYIFKETASAEI